jgi:hypothetical protein
MLNPDLKIVISVKTSVKNTKTDQYVDEGAKLTVYGDAADVRRLVDDFKATVQAFNESQGQQPLMK